MAESDIPEHVAHVGVKLPAFWRKSPRFWFLQAEAQFELAKIKVKSRFNHVVRTLDEDTATQVMDKITNPRAGHEYADLKAALIATYDLPKRDRATRLADMGGLGDKKPSQLLNEMKALLGSEPQNLLFEHHFLANLPDDIRMAIAQQEFKDLDALAAAADKMWREKTIPGTNPLSISAMTSKKVMKPRVTLPSSAEDDDGLCFYHRRFGEKATKCRSPCKQGNAAARQ